MLLRILIGSSFHFLAPYFPISMSKLALHLLHIAPRLLQVAPCHLHVPPPCCSSKLLLHVAPPCCTSMFFPRFPSCCSTMFLLHVDLNVAPPCCSFMLHLHTFPPCCTSIFSSMLRLQCCTSSFLHRTSYLLYALFYAFSPYVASCLPSCCLRLVSHLALSTHFSISCTISSFMSSLSCYRSMYFSKTWYMPCFNIFFHAWPFSSHTVFICCFMSCTISVLFCFVLISFHIILLIILRYLLPAA